MLTHRIILASFALLLAHGALAQTNATYLLVSSNTVTPATPTTTIEVWASWVGNQGDYAFIGANYDLTAGEGVFSNPTNVLNGPGSSTGILAGNVIIGALNGQAWNPFPRTLWNSNNPILLATYGWTTTDFTPRTVDLDTSNTTAFIVAPIEPGASVQLFPQEFTPGTGVINVVPAPGAALVLGLPLAWARRRHRC